VPLVAECESFYIIFTYLCYEQWFLEKTTENQKITVFLSTKWKMHYHKNIVGGFYNHDCPEKIAEKRRPTIYNKCIYIYILPNRLSKKCRYVKAINVGCHFNSVFRNITLQNRFKPLIRFEFHHFYNKTRTYNIRFS